MAKVGLKFDKVDITDKRYLDITPALKIDEVFGKLTWRGINEVEQKYEMTLPNPVTKMELTHKSQQVKSYLPR